MRALVDIDEKDIREIDRLARKQNRSRASLIREAVAGYIKENAGEAADEAFGLWAHQEVDGLAFQRKLRSEW